MNGQSSKSAKAKAVSGSAGIFVARQFCCAVGNVVSLPRRKNSLPRKPIAKQPALQRSRTASGLGTGWNPHRPKSRGGRSRFGTGWRGRYELDRCAKSRNCYWYSKKPPAARQWSRLRAPASLLAALLSAGGNRPCLVPSISSTRRSEAASMVPNGECLPSRCVGPSASRHQPGRTAQGARPPRVPPTEAVGGARIHQAGRVD
jgi:hypothetical protein